MGDQVSFDEATRKKEEAGERGTKVHQGCDKLLHEEYLFQEGYSLQEWKMLISFVQWFKDFNPTVLGTETVVWSKKYRYAGTTDLRCTIGGSPVLVDYKTSKAIS